jgi:Siphovirus ReqiPepy6 Gp37-like protein
MDVLRFINPTSATRMEQGKIVNGIRSKMWIERYRDPGEFTFVSTVGSGVGSELPIGSFISHTDTAELMIVENHEITEDKGSEPEITITGRSFETILENRIVGSNMTFPVSGLVVDYNLPSGYTSDQAVNLILSHTQTAYLINDDNALPYVTASSSISAPGPGTPAIARKIKRGTVYQRVIDLLEIDNLGLKTFRPGPVSPYAGTFTYITIHKGTDKSATVIFSYARGAIESADYLWSNKNLKNAAFITSKWVQTVVLPTQKEYARRMMYIDASSVDQDLTVAPTGTTLSDLVTYLQDVGRDALNSQLDISFSKPQLSKNAVKPIYRTDYNVGDIVSVAGDYRELEKMRVVEYVEIEDANGNDGYPTFGEYEG